MTERRRGIPDDCPVRVVAAGVDVIVIEDTRGRRISVRPDHLTKGLVRRLFKGRVGYLRHAWPRVGLGGRVTGIDMNQLRDDFCEAARRRGDGGGW